MLGHESDGPLLTGLPQEELEILKALGALAADRETRAYAVGGIVRDRLLGRTNYDLDVVVEEDAIAFAGAATELLGGTVKAHTRFGTVILVLPDGRKIDIATARSEVYERPGALPTVSSGDMESDLRRRDFTINAMALALNPDDFGALLDPFGGRRDLERRVLRVMTAVSFEDDPTRILRGVRFSARFGLAFEPTTEALLRKAVAERRVDTVSGERLLNELRLILSEDDVWPPVFRLIDWEILPSMVDGWNVPMSVRGTIVEVDRLAAEGGPSRWTALFMVLLEPVDAAVRDAVVERLGAGRHVRALVRELAAVEDGILAELSSEGEVANSRLYSMLHGLSQETLVLVRALGRGGVAAARVALYQKDLAGTTPALTGTDLASLGIPEGRSVGRILRELLSARLDGEVSSAEEEAELAKRLADSLTSGAEADSVSRESSTEGTEPGAANMTDEEQQEDRTGAGATAVADEPETPAADRGRGEAPDPVADGGQGDCGSSPADAGPGEARASARGQLAAERATPAATMSAGAYADSRQEQLVKRPVYEVRLDAFEGPLDLLLHLIREHEIDIYDIPIASITEQYLEYIRFMESLDLALAGEFLEMAATLIRIKVQMLLPRETEDGEEEEDPREQLVRKLVEYKRFKEAAGRLSGLEQERRAYFARGVDPRIYAELEEEEVDMADFLRDVTLFDLVDGLREVLSRVPERIDVHSVDMEEVTVEEQIDRIRAAVRERGSVPFVEVFGEDAGRLEIVATFIALLELIRLGEVRAVQKRNFGEIEIQARVEE